ncbi:MAG: glycosyltransferase [Bacillota bacterium]|nr:glycosyltransferase [Bacillota bacterium]
MKKKVLFVIPTLRMGGAEKSLVSLLKSLDSDKYEVDLFLFEKGGILQKDVPSWVHILEEDRKTRAMILELRTYFKDLLKSCHFGAALARLSITVLPKLTKKKVFSWNRIKKYIAPLEKEYDVAIGYLEGVTDFFVMDKVIAKKKIGWIHIDFTEHNVFPEEIEYYQKFDYLATISQICLDAFLKKIPQVKDKMCVIENITLAEDVIQKSLEDVTDNWDENRVHLVSVGRLEYQKGMDIGAQSAKVLKEKGIPFCWHVYGQGSMKEEIEQYIQANHLEDCFILEGLRSNPYPYMKKADILVQPSRWEGKSIVLDEAKILGKAIVVTDYPSVNDQIQDGITGKIVAIDPVLIADGIECLIQNQQLIRVLEQNTKNEKSQSDTIVKKFEELIW